MDVPKSAPIVATLDQASHIVERFITSAAEKQAIVKHGADPEAAQTLAKKAEKFLRRGCLTHRPAYRPARRAIHHTLEVDPELAAGLERHRAMYQAFEDRLKDLPLAHLEDLRARVIPQLEWPNTFQETYDFSPGDLKSLIESLARDKHFHCGQTTAQEAAKMRQEVMQLLAPYEDSLGFAFLYECALIGSGAVTDAQSLLARLAAAKRHYQVQSGEAPKQGDLADDLDRMADDCEPFASPWTAETKAFFEDRLGTGSPAFLFQQSTRALFERIYPQLALEGEAARLLKDGRDEIIELLKSYPDGLQTIYAPQPDGGMSMTLPPSTVDSYVMLCRDLAAGLRAKQAERSLLVREGQVANPFAKAGPDVQQEGGSNLPPNCTHTADFSAVTWYGERFDFNETEAKCIAILWSEWEKAPDGKPTLHQKTIRDAIGSENADFRLSHVFRGKNGQNRAWGRMIHSFGKGKFYLGKPTDSRTSKKRSPKSTPKSRRQPRITE